MVIETGIARAERDGTRAETRFRLSPKRTSPFLSVGASVQSTAGSRGVRISLINVGYTTFGGGVRVLATRSIRQFPPSLPLPCVTVFHQVPNELYNADSGGLYPNVTGLKLARDLMASELFVSCLHK